MPGFPSIDYAILAGNSAILPVSTVSATVKMWSSVGTPAVGGELSQFLVFNPSTKVAYLGRGVSAGAAAAVVATTVAAANCHVLPPNSYTMWSRLPNELFLGAVCGAGDAATLLITEGYGS